MGIFDVVVLELIWSSFRLFVCFSKMTRHSKTDGRQTKRIDICYSGVVVEHVCNTFDLLLMKVILSLFGALSQNWPVTRQELSIQQHGLKFGSRGGGVVLGCIWVPFTSHCSRLFGVHSVHFSQLVDNLEMAGHRAKSTAIHDLGGTSIKCVMYRCSCRNQGHFGVIPSTYLEMAIA